MFPVDQVRARFPALAVTDGGRPRIYLDAPGGTQACQPAIAAMAGHLAGGTANAGGAFATARATDAMSTAAHQAMAELLGGTADEIAFGPNMTSLTLAVSRALAREWRPGDEVVVTRLDHDANVAPWLLAAEDRDAIVRWLDFDPQAGTLALDQLPGLLGPRTRAVALGGASNALGTLNDVPRAVRMVRQHAPAAMVFVDGVQSVPHVPTDVRAIGCDLLACSPYKFFGPHAGVLWGRAELLGRLAAYKVRPAGDGPAQRFETGTPSFEAQAATLATVDYLAWLGGLVAPSTSDRPARLRAAMAACADHERALGERLLAGLARMNSVRLFGPPTMAGRVPTFALTVEGRHPREVAEALAARGVFAWSGHFYAVETVARLGLADTGGLVRIGLCHYNTADEVDATLAALAEIAGA